MDAKRTSTAELSRLHWRLGHLYADALQQTLSATKLKPALIALHGQTLYHQATAQPYLSQPTRATWQIGEPAVIAERLMLPIVSDFRPADLAAGGQGAPLVPMLDFCLFRHATRNRLLLNLGGIANITALPAACTLADVLAFDTGPANMVIDACMQRHYNRSFDKDGAVAARGRVLNGLINKLMDAPFFSAPPPKSCGREQFGAAFATRLLALCEREHARKQDVIATATALTARSLLDAYRRFCWPHLGQRAPLARATELFAAGGGARNATLMRMLTETFAQLGVTVKTTAAASLPIEAKEAAAFALLGWLTWHGLPGNVPSATGASRAVILGKVTLA
jgi:anhydro-N-acetylmuramic acid kinase